MAENVLLDLSVEVACERYGLDESEWLMQSFTDGAKNVSVGLVHIYNGAKLKASFDREDIRWEEMKRWDDNKKLLYVKQLVNDGKELPEQLVDSFHEVMLKLELPLSEEDEENSILVEDGDAEDAEDAEEFEQKVEGKKKFKRKAV